MQAIELSRGAYVELAAVAAVNGGLGVRLWLRPGALKAGAVVFTLGEERASQLVLMFAERGGLCLRAGAASLTAPGALTEGRWTAVTLTIAADGATTLVVDGALAAVGQVAPVGGRCRLGDPQRGAGFAVAELEITGQGPPLRYTVEAGALVDPQGGAAPVVGEARGVAADELPGLRAARPGALVWDDQAEGLELPAWTADLTGGVTIEAWVRPRLEQGAMTLVELTRPGGEARVAVTIDAGRRGVIVEVAGVGEARAVRVEGVLRADAWQHVCVVIDARGTCRILVDTRQVLEQRVTAIAPARDGVRTACRVGGGKHRYRGELAELRVWRGPLPGDEIAARWLRRACGDERELLACYHLDELGDGVAIDASPRRLHARVVGALAPGDGAGLPLRARDARGGAQVAVAGKLLLDHLPLSLFPEERIDMPGWMPDRRVSSAARYGTVQGSLVRCAVYEVSFVPRGADGRGWSGELWLRVDAAVTVLRSDGGAARLEEWKPGAVQRLRVRETGRARIKVLAGSLDCPTLRVRVPGMDEDCWTLVRPADAAQQQLRSLSATALQRPPAGKAAVLDPKLAADDAAAVTRFMRDAAGGLATPARSNTILKGISLGDVFDPIVGVAEAVGDGVVDLGEDVARLALTGAEATRKLAAAAASTAATAGEAAIRGCIGDAKTLAVDTAGAVWGGVQVIGEIVVDGVKRAFRTVVAGVADVVDAIEAFVRRIGASLREFIEFLAMLFDWERFLRRSDDLYALALRRFDRLYAMSAELRGIPGRIDGLLANARDGAVAQRTIGELFGVDAGAELPDIDQLRYLADAVEDAFASAPPRFAGDDEGCAGPTMLAADGCAQAHAGVAAATPGCVLKWPWDPLGLRVGELLAAPEAMWSAGRAVIDPLAGWLADGLKGSLDRARSTLTARLDVPYLTELIEVVILRGRKLDLLRLVALLGAVPAVVGGGSRRPVGAASSGDKSLKRGGIEDDSDSEAAIRWIQFGFGVFNAGFLVGRAAAEWSERLVAMWALNALSGATTVALGALDLALAAQMDDDAAAGFAVTHGLLGVFGGLWMVVSTGWSIEALAAGEERYHALVDGVVEGVFGTCQLVTMSLAAGLHKTSDDETARGLGFLLAGWGLRGLYRVSNGLDNTKWSFANAATTGCAVAILLVELTDCAWSVADVVMA